MQIQYQTDQDDWIAYGLFTLRDQTPLFLRIRFWVTLLFCIFWFLLTFHMVKSGRISIQAFKNFSFFSFSDFSSYLVITFGMIIPWFFWIFGYHKQRLAERRALKNHPFDTEFEFILDFGADHWVWQKQHNGTVVPIIQSTYGAIKEIVPVGNGLALRIQHTPSRKKSSNAFVLIGRAAFNAVKRDDLIAIIKERKRRAASNL